MTWQRQHRRGNGQGFITHWLDAPNPIDQLYCWLSLRFDTLSSNCVAFLCTGSCVWYSGSEFRDLKYCTVGLWTIYGLRRDVGFEQCATRPGIVSCFPVTASQTISGLPRAPCLSVLEVIWGHHHHHFATLACWHLPKGRRRRAFTLQYRLVPCNFCKTVSWTSGLRLPAAMTSAPEDAAAGALRVP